MANVFYVIAYGEIGGFRVRIIAYGANGRILRKLFCVRNSDRLYTFAAEIYQDAELEASSADVGIQLSLKDIVKL